VHQGPAAQAASAVSGEQDDAAAGPDAYGRVQATFGQGHANGRLQVPGDLLRRLPQSSLVEPLRSKGDVTPTSIDIIRWLEMQCGCQLKAIRTDNGSE
jgi:hypothetical protein